MPQNLYKIKNKLCIQHYKYYNPCNRNIEPNRESDFGNFLVLLNLKHHTPINADHCKWQDRHRKQDMRQEDWVIDEGQLTGVWFRPAFKPVVNNIANKK